MNRPGCQTHFEVRIYYHNASLHSLKKCEEPQSKYDAKTFGAIWSRFVHEWLRSSEVFGLEGKYTFLSDARDFESACLDDAEDNEDVQVSTHLGLNRTVTRHTPSLEIAPEYQTNASLDMRCRRSSRSQQLPDSLSPEAAPNITISLPASSSACSIQYTPTSPQQTTGTSGGEPTVSTVAYPTDSKEREQIARRKAKEEGKEIVKNKRPKIVQDHHDDCGEDLTSLGFRLEDFYISPEQSSTDQWIDASIGDILPIDTITDNIEHAMLFGPCPQLHCYLNNLQIFVATDMTELFKVAQTKGQGVDIAEVCGGEGRASQISVRRRLTAGPNFDLVTQCDITDPKDACAAYTYFDTCTVLVAVLAPNCDCFGPLSQMNWYLHPSTMMQKYESSGKPVACFCGHIAKSQLAKSRDFLCEQPHPSSLYQEGCWPEVLSHPTVRQVPYDRCQLNLKVKAGPNKGLHIRKPSTMTVSCDELAEPFANLKCPGRHQHLQGLSHAAEHSAAQVWTWDEANRVADGIQAVKRRHDNGRMTQRAFPISRENIARAQTGSGPAAGVDPRAPEDRKLSTCPGCKHYRARADPEHTRVIGQCCYPYDEPKIPDCEGCLQHRPSTNDSHTYSGDCKYATAPKRAAHKRQGAHPRDPAQPASADPTSHMPGNDNGIELGAAAEDAALEQLERLGPSSTAATDGGSSSSSSTAARPGRGPDTVERVRRTYADSAAGPENNADWTTFDVQRSLKALRVGTVPQQRLVIRKLHIRWWHASAAAMHKLLERAGCPKTALDLIKPICDTCAACRAWAKPLPESVASLEMADTFNQQVEYDLLFIYKFIIFHCIDRCTRWHETVLIPDKYGPTLIDAIDTWIGRHGPMRELIGDGESGIARDHDTQEYLKRKGVKYVPRAPMQHARFIERRGALLRDVIHRIDAQLQSEGLGGIPFKHRLSEATFAGNALLTVNNHSPYNAVYGRVPNILPDINCPDAENEQDVPRPGQMRHTHRVREIAVNAMVDGTATARLGRVMNTRTLPAGQREGYEVGEEVDIYKPPGTKDVSGWHGPAQIVDITNISRGILSVKSNNIIKDAKLGDVRRHLQFLVFLSATVSTVAGGPGWLQAKQAVEEMSVGQCLLLGYIAANGNWILSKDNNAYGRLYNLMTHFGENHLRLSNIAAVRTSFGVGSLSKLSGYTHAVILWWKPGCEMQVIEQSTIAAVQWQSQHPQHWRTIRSIQFLCTDDDSHHIQKHARAPTVSTVASPVPTDDDSRLSTIPEDDEDEDSLDHFFEWVDDDLKEAAREAAKWIQIEDDVPFNRGHPEPEPEPENFCSYPPSTASADLDPVVTNYHLIAANVRAALPQDHRLEPDPEYVEIAYADNTWKLLGDYPHEVKPDEVVVVRLYHGQAGKKEVVVERDDAILTHEEMRTHANEVKAAMLKELQTWAKLKCISRKARKFARNIIDCKWVVKWKWDQEVVSAADSVQGIEGKSRRVIRARLTVRGFKDVDKGHVDTYAGTSQRYSQRITCSEAVLRQWDMCTTDISKAFLQGVTYEELAAQTGDAVREVNFYLPAYNVPQLQQVEGFEGFDPTTEVIHCDKPGTGSVDAPRCFSIKLSKVTEKAGLIASNVDAELCYCHQIRNGKLTLVAIMTKHVDDLKAAGEKAVLLQIMRVIEEVFGEMKITWHTFTNCGVRHIQDKLTKEITLDQSEYVAQLKLIANEESRGSNSTTLCGPVLHQQYQSLLGAVAYTSLTRVDVLVFIVALQRYSHAPQIIHVKRLNALVKWMQANPRKLAYRKFPDDGSRADNQHIKIIADSSFKKEEEKGHSLRGVLHLRCSGNDPKAGKCVSHILDHATKALRFVTRSTFSAELLGACDAFDHGLMVILIVNEIHTGVPNKFDQRNLREHGGFAVPTTLYIDALSVHASVTSTYVKAPAEKGLLAHVQYLRELLDNNVLHSLAWIDTRDMTADGLTKGSVERALLHDLMSGEVKFEHEMKLWRPALLARQEQTPQ